jgi:hypothetical protein
MIAVMNAIEPLAKCATIRAIEVWARRAVARIALLAIDAGLIAQCLWSAVGVCRRSRVLNLSPRAQTTHAGNVTLPLKPAVTKDDVTLLTPRETIFSFLSRNEKISYPECTASRCKGNASGWTVFLLGCGVEGVCVYGLTKLFSL